MPDYYTVAQVAEKMEVTEAAVRGWINPGLSWGRLRATKHYKSYRIAVVDLEVFLGDEDFVDHFRAAKSGNKRRKTKPKDMRCKSGGKGRG